MSPAGQYGSPYREDPGKALPIALLGLTFDPVSSAQAQAFITGAIQSRQKLVFATPNVNFAAAAAHDRVFRSQVLGCGMSVADGMPLVWISRLLGLGIPERVAGSSLFESLQRAETTRPLRVFFFGGDPGVAEAASAAIAAGSRGMTPAGHFDPGRGSVEDMSSDGIIERINAAQADFLCVALGAVKGHHWIARNAARLDVPVISHLGAVVNFVAGRISRAPAWMQQCGLEWMWRILQERSLLRRYLRDAWWLAGAFATQVLPARIDRLRRPSSIRAFRWSIREDANGEQLLRLHGDLTRDALLQDAGIRNFLKPDTALITVDLEDTGRLDSEGVAWLLRFCYSGTPGAPIRLRGARAETMRSLRLYGAGFIIKEFA